MCISAFGWFIFGYMLLSRISSHLSVKRQEAALAMKILRAFVALFSAVAAFYLTYWLVGALLLPPGTPELIRLLLSLAAAITTGYYMWQAQFASGGLAAAIATGAILVGGLGFCAGFFGPLIFAPRANQGPLLGIFITGPLGVVIGAVGGAVRWWWRKKRSSSGSIH